MSQKELSWVEALRFLRKLGTVKPWVSAETSGSHCSEIGKLVIEMLPKGELEAFFLLLGGIDCSPLGTIKPTSPVQSYVLTSFICLKCIRLQQLYGLTLVGILLFCLVWWAGGGGEEGCHSEPPHPYPRVISALLLHKGVMLELCQAGSMPHGDPPKNLKNLKWASNSLCSTAFHQV